MNKDILKKIGLYCGIILLFLVLAYATVPQVLTGKVVNQSDISGYLGMSREASQWNQAHPDDETHWTDAMFGGMPTTSFQSSHKGDWTQPIYDLLLSGKRPATYLFISLLGAFLLMLSLGIGIIPAIGGAIAITFCSYNFQIIQVGHNTKMQALAFLPWVLAAVIFTYKKALADVQGWKKWVPTTLLGSSLFALALSLQIKANHQQITYYLALIIFVYVVALFIWLLLSAERRAKISRFFAASALLLVLGLVGIGTNAIKLAPLYEYTSHTMRGGSELSAPTGGQINNDGLQLDYATAWSYGWQELPNMMIPNFNGGSSAGKVNPDKSAVVELFRQAGQGNPEEISKSLPMYWGPQPFTAGPMYMGSITIFLFLLGLFLCKGKEKWWILAATILAIFLGVGNHMMWFTKLFFNYAPMYNKFRTVSMSLVILQFTLPMLGFIVLDKIMKNEFTKKEFLNKGLVALALTAGISLILAVLPSLAGSFSGAADAQMQDIVVDALKQDRRHLLSTDALYSTIFVVGTFLLLLWGYSIPKNAPKTYASDPHVGQARRTQAVIGICVLIFLNMFAIGKRYLNSDSFVSPRDFSGRFTARPVDKAILEDADPSYRVLDLTSDVFNDSFASYWHKSIGGYSPAKLQRYQDLIERYITPELQTVYVSLKSAKTIADVQNNLPQMPIMSALNCKYVIIDGNASPVVNPNAFGNAWFVDSLSQVSTPDEEINSLGDVDLRKTVIIGKDFADAAASVEKAVSDTLGLSGDSIVLSSYAPNRLTFHYKTSAPRATVFSEVFYPKGWKAMVDGEEIPLFRADWILRGAVLPLGEHDIVMTYEPEVYAIGEKTSRASSILLIMLLIIASAGMIKRQ